MVNVMPSRTINGAAVHYDERGTGQPLVLLHGFPLSSRIWSHQVEHLSRESRVITPDFRGFGQSPPAGPFTVASLADDVHALLTKIGALPCTLGGLSMGGYVALAFAKKYAKDLRALILVDTRSEADSADGKAARNKMIELVRSSGARAVADQMLPKMLTEATVKNGARLTSEVRQIMESCPPQTIAHALVALREREDYSTILPSIAVPTLILVGEADPITPPSMAKALHDAIPRSQLKIIPAAAHLSSMERPSDVTDAIRTFVQNKNE
jgi:3-oxoadipate enol-lactonase